MVEECLLCGHTTEEEEEMSLHLGDDHSSWDLAEYAYECCVKSGSKYDPKPRKRVNKMSDKRKLLKIIAKAQRASKTTWEGTKNEILGSTARYIEYLLSHRHFYLVKTVKTKPYILPKIPKRFGFTAKYSDNSEWALIITNWKWKRKKKKEL